MVHLCRKLEMQLLPKFTETEEFILFSIFCLAGFIQLFWLLFFYSRLAFHKQKIVDSNLSPISVIIVARNEEDNLFHNLPKVLEQNYPHFEVIVVNHQSSDNTAYILKAFQRKYAHLKIIEIERNKHLRNGKKLPLTVAIKGAKYEHLLFTDADCRVNSPNWIRHMSENFSSKKQLLIGYGPYLKEKGILNWLIRLDAQMIAMNYLSFAKARVPYMAVGRNFGYTKSLFHSVNGFKSHYSLQSGDDDLFVQDAARKNNYTISIHPDTFQYSETKKDWNEWYDQKSRHFSTADNYRVIKKLMLGIYPLSLLIFCISFIYLLLINDTLIVLGLFAVMLLLKWIIQGKALLKLKDRSFIWLFPMWDIFYAILAPVLYYTSPKINETKWR